MANILVVDDELGIRLGERILKRLSDNALFMSAALPKRKVLLVRYQLKKRLADKLGAGGAHFATELWQRLQNKRWL